MDLVIYSPLTIQKVFFIFAVKRKNELPILFQLDFELASPLHVTFWQY